MKRSTFDWIGWAIVVFLWGGALVAIIFLAGGCTTAVIEPQEYHNLEDPKECLTHFILLHASNSIEFGADFDLTPGLGRDQDSNVKQGASSVNEDEMALYVYICYSTDEAVRQQIDRCVHADSCKIFASDYLNNDRRSE